MFSLYLPLSISLSIFDFIYLAFFLLSYNIMLHMIEFPFPGIVNALQSCKFVTTMGSWVMGTGDLFV
jgi:hypothetical protein